MARLVISLLAFVPLATSARADTTQSAQKLLVAGNDRVLWLGLGNWEAIKGGTEEAFHYRFAFLDESWAKIRPLNQLPRQIGDIVHCAVAGKRLHVFFGRDAHSKEIGGHYSYEWTEDGERNRPKAQREQPLPNSIMPMAIAGDSAETRPYLWAVVTTDTGKAIQHQLEVEQAEQEDDHDEADIASRPSMVEQDASARSKLSGYQIVQYDGTRWHPGPTITSVRHKTEGLWLAVSKDQFHLFWQQQPEDLAIHYACHDRKASSITSENWQTGPAIPLGQAPTGALAAIINRRLVFTAMLPDSKGSGHIEPQIWIWNGGDDPDKAWRLSSALTEKDGEREIPLRISASSVATAFRDKLIILRQNGSKPEVGFFSPGPGGLPERPFAEVPFSHAVYGSPADERVKDLATMLVVLALVTLLFWRRQDGLTAPLPLPTSLWITSSGKRALAAAVDMIPAGLCLAIFWHDSLADFLPRFWSAMTATLAGRMDGTETFDVPQDLTIGWIWFRIIYVIYGIAFESTLSTTPGKILLRSMVRLENLEKPGFLQVVVRNITKLLELEPALRIWPFMLVIFFTRNRQRVGDLLARTIVVERQSAPSKGNMDEEIDREIDLTNKEN